MKKISKFIPMDGTGEENASGMGGLNGTDQRTTDEGSTGESTGTGEGTTWTTGTTGTTTGGTVGGTTEGDTTFKVCTTSTNLPAKPGGFFSKLKAILFYEIKVELTPYQQKVEDEINAFLHQEVTWQGFKNFLFQDISFSKKNKTKQG